MSSDPTRLVPGKFVNVLLRPAKALEHIMDEDFPGWRKRVGLTEIDAVWDKTRSVFVLRAKLTELRGPRKKDTIAWKR